MCAASREAAHSNQEKEPKHDKRRIHNSVLRAFRNLMGKAASVKLRANSILRGGSDSDRPA